MNRNDYILKLRPTIVKAVSNESTSASESFQNLVVRPNVKFQHDLIIAITNYYTLKFFPDYKTLSKEKQFDIIDSIFNSNNQLKNEIKGVVIGLLTIEEYKQYKIIKSDTNKRIIQICKERVLTNLEQL